jgi:hypothetical protein
MGELVATFVSANGTLDNKKIMKSEKLYQGTNGRFVERFYISPSESYIFKPLTNESQIGKELWVYENILTQFPPIYPRILAHSRSSRPDTNWMILEDLGKLRHVFEGELVLRVVKWVGWWHRFPIKHLANVGLKGPKPMISEITRTIFSEEEKLLRILIDNEMDPNILKLLHQTLHETKLDTDLVLSHGDLHLGNYAYSQDSIVVLDWEHAHLNLPYWDLYHLLDLTHPVYPKWPSSEIRVKALEMYLNEFGEEEHRDRALFKQHYFLFSIIFSLWVLLLIEKDLERNDTKWTMEQLERQKRETVEGLRQILGEV